MKQTGVFRRIDGLGRIVIPKEIRNSLKINDGESLEIFTDDDKVVLKKYSFMSDLTDISNKFCDSFYDTVFLDIIITDRDKVIGASLNLKKKYLGKEISNYLNSLIQKRIMYVDNESNEIVICNEVEEYYYVCSPVISNSETVGCVLILSKNNICASDKSNALFISKFLSKHLSN